MTGLHISRTQALLFNGAGSQKIGSLKPTWTVGILRAVWGETERRKRRCGIKVAWIALCRASQAPTSPSLRGGGGCPLGAGGVAFETPRWALRKVRQKFNAFFNGKWLHSQQMAWQRCIPFCIGSKTVACVGSHFVSENHALWAHLCCHKAHQEGTFPAESMCIWLRGDLAGRGQKLF